MPPRSCSALALVILLALAPAHSIWADVPGKVDLEGAEMLAELVGAPVFAGDGIEIGEVADISIDDEGRPDKLRLTTSARLGLGTRTIEIPRGAFITLRGAVVLDLPAEAIQSLPDDPDLR